MNIQLLSHMYNYVCMYMYVCMLSTCIYYSTFYFDSGGADCTRNVSLLTHLKHRVSISVFQFFSPILKALIIYYQYLWMYQTWYYIETFHNNYYITCIILHNVNLGYTVLMRPNRSKQSDQCTYTSDCPQLPLQSYNTSDCMKIDGYYITQQLLL